MKAEEFLKKYQKVILYLMNDKCKNCPFNDTDCPRGAWCTEGD